MLATRLFVPTVIALGDAPNDASMLGKADIAVVIPNPAGSSGPDLSATSSSQIIYADQPGPAGWNSAILAILANKTSYEYGGNSG